MGLLTAIKVAAIVIKEGPEVVDIVKRAISAIKDKDGDNKSKDSSNSDGYKDGTANSPAKDLGGVSDFDY